MGSGFDDGGAVCVGGKSQVSGRGADLILGESRIFPGWGGERRQERLPAALLNASGDQGAETQGEKRGRHLWHISLWRASSWKAMILQWRTDEYSILPYSFIIGVHGYVLVYSVTSLHSFQVIESLYQKLHEGHGKTRLPVVLVGNKADLSPDREVQAVEGKKLAESWGATFMESSARENQLTRGIFTKVIQEIARVENSYGQERRCRLM
ncbi:GTPase RhebL1 isoform X1 [Leptonychotes weddellii]|uniref:GTPase RhebL1 isoform X1 n=1 Tax=Leptonychotes weddellii TaxID=9713 RepID=A0A7F8QEB9_LEPWE|nr:GTPase RhebL1 isoform X1 [Leptonychotes weddellii]